MTLEEFRILHSTLIENYQYIEAHLEGTYAVLSGKSFSDGLREVEKDSMSRLVGALKKLEDEKGISVLSDEERETLLRIIKRRNFWVHNCYYDMPFNVNGGGPKKQRDTDVLLRDLRESGYWRDTLFERKMKLCE